MSIYQYINEISDKGAVRVSCTLMTSISRICTDILGRSDAVPYNWDVITLYFAPENGPTEQKERYGRPDALALLTAWSSCKKDVSSSIVARALQGLAYILETSVDVSDEALLRGLECRIIDEYSRVGSPLN